MKTYFAGIRRWSGVMAVGVPLLMGVAFLMLALGARWWAVAPWVLGMIAGVSFPPGLRKNGSARGMLSELKWLSLPGTLLIYFWLIQQPEMQSFTGRLLSGEALREWPVVAGAVILMLAAMVRRWRAVQALTDQEIYEFFETPKGAGMVGKR